MQVNSYIESSQNSIIIKDLVSQFTNVNRDMTSSVMALCVQPNPTYIMMLHELLTIPLSMISILPTFVMK